jgi:hypothetical protein
MICTWMFVNNSGRGIYNSITVEYGCTSYVLREWWNGRHACFRSKCRKVWRFKSSLAHHYNRYQSAYARNQLNLLYNLRNHGSYNSTL